MYLLNQTPIPIMYSSKELTLNSSTKDIPNSHHPPKRVKPSLRKLSNQTNPKDKSKPKLSLSKLSISKKLKQHKLL